MRKLENFKNEKTNLLSDFDMHHINGGLAMSTSRYTCWTQTSSSGCCDVRCEKTRDYDDGTVVTETYEVDHNC